MILQFAWRYIMGKKSTQAVQIISWVSVLAMAVGTAALIVVLSVFNGFEFFIKTLYSDFYPALKISAIKGKNFSDQESVYTVLKNTKGINSISKTLEEKVLFSYEDNQIIGTLKGIDTAYLNVTHINKNVKDGYLSLSDSNELANIVLGVGMSNRLGISDISILPLNCYSFKKESNSMMDMAQAYNNTYFTVTGVYYLQEEIDNQFAFASLNIVQQLTQNDNNISSLELSFEPNADIEKIQKQLNPFLNKFGLTSATRYEQNKTLYFILKSERWAVYAILTLMLIIASFNIVGSLSMLVIEKQKDIAILKAMGMQNSQIKKIFLTTGIFLSVLGASIGCILAATICIVQQQFGLVKLGGSGSFLIEAYPVKMLAGDFVLVMTTVVVIAIFASWIPSVKASKKPIELRVK